jgi:hypothetical protein
MDTFYDTATCLDKKNNEVHWKISLSNCTWTATQGEEHSYVEEGIELSFIQSFIENSNNPILVMQP